MGGKKPTYGAIMKNAMKPDVVVRVSLTCVSASQSRSQVSTRYSPGVRLGHACLCTLLAVLCFQVDAPAAAEVPAAADVPAAAAMQVCVPSACTIAPVLSGRC